MLKKLHDSTPRISKHDWPKNLLKIKHLFAKPDREEDDWLALKNPDAIGDYVHGTYCHTGRLPKVILTLKLSLKLLLFKYYSQ